MAVVSPPYRCFRYPVAVISHCVWLYHRFLLSFRKVEEMSRIRSRPTTWAYVARRTAEGDAA